MSEQNLAIFRDILLTVALVSVLVLFVGRAKKNEEIDHLKIHVKSLESRVQDLETQPSQDKATASGEGSVANTGDGNAINWAMTLDNVIVPAHRSEPAHCIAGQMYLDTHDPAHKVLKGCIAKKWKVVEDWREQ